MLLTLDAGNTNVTVGVFEGARLVASRRVETAEVARGALRACLRRLPFRVDAAVLGSVAPSVDRRAAADVMAVFGVRLLQVGPRSPLGIKLKVERPGQVGADRVLNALAASRLSRGASVVVDFGTATTFDCVSAGGDYLGGAILPGPHLAAKALRLYTEKLPLVAVARPRRAIGRTTVECIQAGVYFGYLGMIEKLLALTLAELRRAGHGPRIRVIGTGGLAGLFAAELPRMKVEPDLTLHGLRLAHGLLAGKGIS